MFGEYSDDDWAGQTLRVEASERRNDIEYEQNKQVFHRARSMAVLAGAITAFITFCAFMIAGFGIQETAAWMFALSLMTASAIFVVIHIATSNSLTRKQQTVESPVASLARRNRNRCFSRPSAAPE